MPYITSIEEISMELGKLKNAKESVIEALEIRFDNVPKTIVSSLNQINDILYLKQLHKRAILIDSLVNFELLLTEMEKEVPRRKHEKENNVSAWGLLRSAYGRNFDQHNRVR